MNTTVTENQKNIAALIHISTFAKYFFPFANFFVPLLLWTFNKENRFLDNHGRQAINFQLSILIYMLGIVLICIPFVILFATDFVSLMQALDHSYNTISYGDIKNLSGYLVLAGIAGLLLFGLLIFEIYAVINAAIYASKGLDYQYPFCISFIKTINLNQSKNEHIS